MQEFFDAEIKKLKLKPYYFPLFVTENVLQKENDNIEGFAQRLDFFSVVLSNLL